MQHFYWLLIRAVLQGIEAEHYQSSVFGPRAGEWVSAGRHAANCFCPGDDNNPPQAQSPPYTDVISELIYKTVKDQWCRAMKTTPHLEKSDYKT